MKVFTDNIDFAGNYLPSGLKWDKYKFDISNENIGGFIKEIFQDKVIFRCSRESEESYFPGFKYIFLIKHSRQSHYDLLLKYCRQGNCLPDRLLCLAGSGDKFHGFKNRHWKAMEGNIHLVAYFRPMQKIENFGPGFMAMAAVSAVQTIDSISELDGKAKIKWVNDILIDNAKVCGVLAYSQSEGEKVTDVVIGLGLNVAHKPAIEPTIFVPQTGCLDDFSILPSDPRNILELLIRNLAENYQLILDDKYRQILDFYRERSAVLGNEVVIFDDTEDKLTKAIARGVVRKIGSNLELFLEGNETPIIKGRLQLNARG